ncbi:MAG: hypothetical protein KAI71_03910 [Candidatus Pacebacteria bacterium]|nr:hypothetical protein [Candidatus Paceibacterota bacterium]
MLKKEQNFGKLGNREEEPDKDVDLLEEKNIYDLNKLVNNYDLSSKIELTEDIKESLRKCIIESLDSSNAEVLNPILRTLDSLDPDSEIASSKEVQDAVEKFIFKKVLDGYSTLSGNTYYEFVKRIAVELQFSDEQFQKTVEEAIVMLSDTKGPELVFVAKDNFKVSNNIFSNETFKENIQNHLIEEISDEKFDPSYMPQFIDYLSKNNIDFELPISFEETHSEALKNIEVLLEFHLSNLYAKENIIKIKEIFNVQDDTFTRVISDKTLDIFDKQWDSLQNKKDDFEKSFPLSEENKKEIIKSAVFREISKNNIEKASEIQKLYDVDFITDEEYKDFFKQEIEKRDWEAIVSAQLYLDCVQSLYQEFLNDQKEIAQDPNLSHQEKQESFEALAGLAESGEESITKEFVEIIQKRGKEKGQSKQAEISESGFDNVQNGVYNTLLLLDNPDSNEALFGLLDNESIDRDVKFNTLAKLTSENRNFLSRDSRRALGAWLFSKPLDSLQKLDWQDLRFIKAIQNNIPSSELKEKSELLISPALTKLGISLNGQEKSINQIWQENYSNIPENVFLQLSVFTNSDEDLMDKLQILYSSIKKEGTKKENLLYGIINLLDSDPNILRLLVNKLKEVDFSSKEDADCLSEVLRNTVFLDKIDEAKDHNEGDYGHYHQVPDEEGNNNMEFFEINPEIENIFSKEVNNLEELKELLKEIVTKKIQEVLPNENITAKKIENIEKQWGNLEPIFTYLGRYPDLKKYIAEMVVNFDSEENWKDWRYDLENKEVDKQIGHLSEEQLEVWKEEYFAEVGDIMIAERGSDIPREIQNILKDAIITHKHIFNPEMEMNENEFIQKIFEKAYDKIEENPEKKDEITEDEINKIKTDSKQIDTIINFNDLPRVKESLKTTFAPDAEIKMSKKVKNLIGFMVPYLSKESFEIIKENCEKVENKDGIKVSDEKSDDEDKIKVDEILPTEIRKTLEENISETEKEFENLQDSDIWEKLQLDKNNLKNLNQFYQKRKEIKSTIDLLRLNNLSNKLIATNRIVEKEGKKGGEKLNSVLDNLKKYLKGSPLLQDIKNIEFSLKEKTDMNEKRRLAMVSTDNPQMLWQAGKYPLGNGSCQHYADGGYNLAKNLMGYVGDANCKVSYLVDLNKLSQDIKKELEEKEFEEIKNDIPAQELLNASIARSIIKMTKDENDKPVVLLEPTYSIVYKSDNSMDKYFNLFVDLMIAESMKVKMARSGGKESVSRGPSRSPGGQYEDSNLDNVKFIHKLSKPTKEDEDMMERIRSSR